MFICVQYGCVTPGSQAPETFMNANCACEILRDDLTTRCQKEIGQALGKRRDEERRAIAGLSRHLSVHTRHLAKWKEEKESLADSDKVEQIEGITAKIGKTEGWVEACEKEIKTREEVLTVISEKELQLQNLEFVDLADPADGQLVQLGSFPPKTNASAVIPLRAATVAYGIRKENASAISLVFELPFVERSEEVSEMLQKK
eukprot:GEMP01063847.1.p1 GENE.GEMP01063847.1~~GEMP01063847.1.p1  ORF type:complete len:202 (+),score=45.05 GEMP01063847.1:11-616(+)